MPILQLRYVAVGMGALVSLAGGGDCKDVSVCVCMYIGLCHMSMQVNHGIQHL